ncbi:hypothetical protein CYMTET_21585 [Cymbomonas tetramitiformis]|uniref:B30.2/SPRY domain-containing protein n=1 Tax=Cymbomonas tetramitiformis TaxID=36881 RepID=A0AAE0G286_9CHLO|nr:hypothetical protein CYMTET_21585 [Cymbomonas tetramitiformis]
MDFTCQHTRVISKRKAIEKELSGVLAGVVASCKSQAELQSWHSTLQEVLTTTDKVGKSLVRKQKHSSKPKETTDAETTNTKPMDATSRLNEFSITLSLQMLLHLVRSDTALCGAAVQSATAALSSLPPFAFYGKLSQLHISCLNQLQETLKEVIERGPSDVVAAASITLVELAVARGSLPFTLSLAEFFSRVGISAQAGSHAARMVDTDLANDPALREECLSSGSPMKQPVIPAPSGVLTAEETMQKLSSREAMESSGVVWQGAEACAIFLAPLDMIARGEQRLGQTKVAHPGCIDQSLEALPILQSLISRFIGCMHEDASDTELFVLASLLRLLKVNLAWMSHKLLPVQAGQETQTTAPQVLGEQKESLMRTRLVALLQTVVGQHGALPHVKKVAALNSVRMMGVGALIAGVEYFFPTLEARMAQVVAVLPQLQPAACNSSHLVLAAHLLQRVANSPDLAAALCAQAAPVTGIATPAGDNQTLVTHIASFVEQLCKFGEAELALRLRRTLPCANRTIFLSGLPGRTTAEELRTLLLRCWDAASIMGPTAASDAPGLCTAVEMEIHIGLGPALGPPAAAQPVSQAGVCRGYAFCVYNSTEVAARMVEAVASALGNGSGLGGVGTETLMLPAAVCMVRDSSELGGLVAEMGPGRDLAGTSGSGCSGGNGDEAGTSGDKSSGTSKPTGEDAELGVERAVLEEEMEEEWSWEGGEHTGRNSMQLLDHGHTIKKISSSPDFSNARASLGFTAGVHAWEIKVNQCDDRLILGVAKNTWQLKRDIRDGRWLEDTQDTWIWQSNNRGLKHSSRLVSDVDTTSDQWGFTTGDTIGFRLDMDEGTLQLFRNGSNAALKLTHGSKAPICGVDMCPRPPAVGLICAHGPWLWG